MRIERPIGRAGNLLILALCVTLLTGAAASMAAEPAGFEVVARLNDGPGNITAGPDGRVFVSLHQFFEPKYRVVELMKDGTTRPYPNEKWASAPGEDGIGLSSVLGLRAGADGILWLLDNGGTVPKLVAWDTRSERLHRIIHLPAPGATRPGSFHNDLALDPNRNHAYLADVGLSGNPAIVVVDLVTGAARRVLEKHPSVMAEDTEQANIVIDGQSPRMLREGKVVSPRVALNPITIDPAHEWVYYGAMNGTSLYRVRAADLADESLSAEALAGGVERYGDKAPSDGISVDSAGNVYITDLNASGIGVTSADGAYRLLFSDPTLSWPDAITVAADGSMLVVCNQLHRSPALNAGAMTARPPYLVVRFKPLAPSAVGR